MLRLKKLKSGLARLRGRLKDAFKKGDREALEELMISADMGVEITEELLAESGGNRERLSEIIAEILKQAEKDFTFPSRPTVVMVAGTNGSGKTTTVAKLAVLWREREVLIAAADTYRDAAGLQLESWAKSTQTDLVASTQGQDAGAVVYDALKKALAKDYGLVLLDTAGRLHTRRDLMAEASKIRRVSAKVISGAPHEILLVMDASTGQNGLRQVEGFAGSLDVTGLVVTKLDGTSKAGVIIPIVKRFGLPIYFLGVGEQATDIIPFKAREFTQALLGG
ncbi:signal recognition particle-docking protein FtsY [candidate division WOR-3 bacterium]|uniref:Signal recognition particle-docking protein FtsY n=1 Tax=candidate division WOR-3 bacterium TaxID=2052148 RepID=A0A9D5K7U4_UNCW3|nr:signal recognition particle-docking protein FtsY [candidate division WOR-3 bacterium]MBD3363893.1 signal recognition particle-docking protein FtsY [candidate division WOR-3 bacterium]